MGHFSGRSERVFRAQAHLARAAASADVVDLIGCSHGGKGRMCPGDRAYSLVAPV